MESLIGLFNFACRVIKPGRSFLLRLINLLKGVCNQNHHIHLNKEARAKIHWWHIFITLWNGVSFYDDFGPRVQMTSETPQVSGDVVQSLTRNGFSCNGLPSCSSKHIAFKELLPIILAVSAWGRTHRGCHLHCLCDNAVVVSILSSRYSRQPDLMHLLHCLFFLEAYYDIHITA